MPLDTYANLQASILSWLARPGDPLVSPSIPDIIQLFEHEATRRLKVGGAEKRASLTALSAAVALPADFGELRLATSGGVILTYVTPMQLPDGGGPPAHYTIIGNEMRLGPSPSGGCTVEVVYQSGVPPLSDSNPSNWLLAAHPDCYLFGSLVEAESFIGSDERIPLWAQRREAAFASIETADRKARWGGAPLSIRAEGVSGGNGTAAGDWTSAPPVPIPIAGIVAGDGLTGGGTAGIVTVALDTPVAISRGGTGAATAAAALANLGAAPLASPVFTGDPRAPTPLTADNDTSIATTAYVQAQGYRTANQTITLSGDVTGSGATAIAATVARLQGRAVSAAAPASGNALVWSGTAWQPGGAGSSITVGDTPPASPAVGNGWWDSIGGQLYLWYDDGTSTQWVPATNTGSLPAGTAYDQLVYAGGTWSAQRARWVASCFVPGTPAASQLLLLQRLSKAITFPANFGAYLGHASQARGTVNATASTAFDVQKATSAAPGTFSSVGTVTVAAGAMVGTFATSGGVSVSFAQGDTIALLAPATPDATFANFAATLVGSET